MFNLHSTATDWKPIITKALLDVDTKYLNDLEENNNWLPGRQNIFNAFKLPLKNTKYILFGESPYPRFESANGYAFWDAKGGKLWSETGLSKTVNKATSLRNIIKMLLLTSNEISDKCLQSEIAKIDKNNHIKTIDDLFIKLQKSGVLLLNASLVLSSKKVSYDAKAWLPFVCSILEQMSKIKPSIKLLLFGKIAQKLMVPKGVDCLIAEHPYNVSFIHNKEIQAFFKPMNLLKVA